MKLLIIYASLMLITATTILSLYAIEEKNDGEETKALVDDRGEVHVRDRQGMDNNDGPHLRIPDPSRGQRRYQMAGESLQEDGVPPSQGRLHRQSRPTALIETPVKASSIVRILGFDPRPHHDREEEKDILLEALEEIWWQESRCGQDPEWRKPGPAGEKGQWRVTPDWEEDIWRLFKELVYPFEFEQTGEQIYRWLKHYKPYYHPQTRQDYAEMFKRGPEGFRKWKER